MMRLWILAILVMVTAGAAPMARPGATRPGQATRSSAATRPARGQQAAHDPLVDEAVAAVNSDALLTFAGRVEPELSKAMADLKKLDSAAVVRLATLREFGRYFGRVKSVDEGQKLILAWLIQQKDLAQTLMMSVGEFDPPDRVLEVLRELRESHRELVAQDPELTSAMCVVWDEPGKGGGAPDENAKTDVRTPARMFGYFTKARLRFDPRGMPLELLAFVVDLHLSEEELAFVQGRYESVASPGPAYFDPPFDEMTQYDVTGKDVTRARTLPNLLRGGGAAVDQAYYAACVGKALGIPTVAMKGIGVTSASAPIWVTFLKGSGGGVSWDGQAGRRREHDDWPGEASDPRTGDAIGEGDLMMVAELAGTRPADRMLSMALVKSADALPADKQLAALAKAVELAPGNRLAWERVADQARTAKLPTAQQKQVDELYRRVLLRRVPEYALAWRMRMIKDRAGPERVAALKKMGDEFRSWPALFSMARVALGDAWADEKRRDEALAAYEEALARSPNSGPIAVLVMERIDPLMHKTNELERLAEIYSKAFGMSERIRPSAWARTTPFYMLGDRYVQVLQELNDESRAQGVRAQLENVVQLGQGPGQNGR